MRPLDVAARGLAYTIPSTLVYLPDVLTQGAAALYLDAPRLIVAAGVTALSVAFHVYDVRWRAAQAARERARVAAEAEAQAAYDTAQALIAAAESAKRAQSADRADRR